jgi:hypothetical protein
MRAKEECNSKRWIVVGELQLFVSWLHIGLDSGIIVVNHRRIIPCINTNTDNKGQRLILTGMC